MIAFFALLAIYPAWAQAQVRSVEIVQYGIYTADLQSFKRDSQGIKQSVSTNFRRAATTTTTTAVPAQLGVRFGMSTKSLGLPAAKRFH